MIKFDVRSRFTGDVQFTAEIDCAEDAANSVKLGLAVRWAIKNSANLGFANLRGADLGGANLGGANLGGANLRGADLGGANLGFANLRGADLGGANLGGANLRGADLGGADLGGANLRGADLGGADLGGANLGGANLGFANLGFANLGGANLGGAKAKSLLAVAIRVSDGYSFFAFDTDLGVRVFAGCRRNFTTADFRTHVAVNYPNTPKAAETLAILDFIEARTGEKK